MKANAELAMYRGPATGWKNKLGHWGICLLTISPYSHVELVIDGVCYSSSYRDGGVRAKIVPDLRTSGHFDLFPIQIDTAAALARFYADAGKPYDWVGLWRVSWLFRWLRPSTEKRFCSEEVIWMALGVNDPETFSPKDVLAALSDLIPETIQSQWLDNLDSREEHSG